MNPVEGPNTHQKPSPPPKGVPMKRKPVRGRGMKDYCYYDPYDEELYIYRGGKLITQNKYTPLCTEDMLQSTECYECYREHQLENQPPRIVHLRGMEDFRKAAKGHWFCKDCNCKDINAFIVTNKNNLFTGYFVDPIYYPPIDSQLLFQEGFTKQLSSKFSRYNLEYFCNMHPIYKMCKKFWKPQITSPSCSIADYSSGTGTVMETPINQKLFQNSNSIITSTKNPKNCIKKYVKFNGKLKSSKSTLNNNNNNVNNNKFINDSNKNSSKKNYKNNKNKNKISNLSNNNKSNNSNTYNNNNNNSINCNKGNNKNNNIDNMISNNNNGNNSNSTNSSINYNKNNNSNSNKVNSNNNNNCNSSNTNKNNLYNRNTTSNCIISKQMDATSCSNFGNLEKSNRDLDQILKSQIYFSYPINGADTSPGIRTLGSTCLPYHLDHLKNTLKQPLSYSTAASSPNIGAGVRGKGGGG